jgi:OOP family OmpA-OmpF porin
MRLKKSLVATLVSAFVCVPAAAEQNGDFHKKLYIGVSGGVSKLSPETAGTAFQVDDEDSDGSKVFIGWDFHPHFALELGYADLGEAEIGPAQAGEISYEVTEAGLVYHFYNFGGYDRLIRRRGLGAFWKIGAGKMDNESELDFRRDNDYHVTAGFGVEYGTPIGLAVRGEVEAYDEDALYASLGLLWRLGRGAKDAGAAAAAGLIAGANDADGDGVDNDLDDCADTPSGAPVSASGCAMFDGTLDGVLFNSGSDELTDEAQVVLNDAADVMLKYPDVVVEVHAHTDSAGEADFNLDLSKRRALSTVRYLMLRGVPSSQLQARAFGESKPIEDNSTAAGRKANRRVEFHVIEQ